MLKHTIILISNANLLITTKNFAQDSKGKVASYLLEAYGDTIDIQLIILLFQNFYCHKLQQKYRQTLF